MSLKSDSSDPQRKTYFEDGQVAMVTETDKSPALEHMMMYQSFSQNMRNVLENQNTAHEEAAIRVP